MLQVMEQALDAGSRHQADRLLGQGSIFDLGDVEEQRVHKRREVPVIDAKKDELLRLEKETLGLYVSEHPLAAVKDQLRRKTECTLNELQFRRDGEIVTTGGIVASLRQMTTKKGDPMVFVGLEDVTGQCEVVAFNSVYATSRELLTQDRILIVRGRVDQKGAGETKLVAMEITSFEAVPERREVRLKVDARKAPAGLIRDLADIVDRYPGEAPVYIETVTSLGPKLLELGKKVQPIPDFYAEAKTLLGEAAVA
jgi:DNA polymerase-3 subunit alpha